VIVVLGHRADEVEDLLKGEGVETVLNPRFREGMLTSIQAGVEAAGSTAWLGVALADQPWIRPETVALLLESAQREGTEPLTAPSYMGRRGHPLLIPGRFREEILALPPEQGLRLLLQRHADEILHVETADAGPLGDMDTPDDYASALERLARDAADDAGPVE